MRILKRYKFDLMLSTLSFQRRYFNTRIKKGCLNLPTEKMELFCLEIPQSDSLGMHALSFKPVLQFMCSLIMMSTVIEHNSNNVYWNVSLCVLLLIICVVFKTYQYLTSIHRETSWRTCTGNYTRVLFQQLTQFRGSGV